MQRLKQNFKKFFISKKIPAYIHIPKTGGTYLSQLESTRIPVISPIKYLGHTCIVSTINNRAKIYPPKIGFLPNYITHKNNIKNNFVFATVRNVFSWLVSYAAHAGGWNPRYNDPNHYDFDNANKGFDYLVKTIADREGDIWPNRKIIHFQIFSDDGYLVTDWLNRTESLDSDLDELAKHVGIKYQKKTPQRIGTKNDYRRYYNNELIDIVYRTWGRELKLFGFDFDSTNINSAILKKQIDKKTKKKVQYFLKDDLLLIDKREFLG